MRGVRAALYLGLALLFPSGAAAAQGWVVDASAGAAEYEAVAGAAGSLHAMLTVRREGTSWLSLSAGAPLDSAAIPWAAAGGGTRLSRGVGGGFDVGADLGVVGFGYEISELDATGGGATLIALPFVAFDMARSRVELRSGALHHTTFFDGESDFRTVLDTGIRGSLTLSPIVRLEAEGRVVRDATTTYPFAGAAAEVAAGPATLWLRGGRWFADELDASGWGIGARMPLAAGVVLRAAFDQDTDDPLYWNGPRSGWTVGLSRALGGRTRSGANLPLPESFRRPAGTVVLRVPIDESGEVPSVAGDFTEWETVPMRRGTGGWEATFELSPGVYHYSFVRPDGTWFLPTSIENRVDDGFGGTNAVLVVAGS